MNLTEALKRIAEFDPEWLDYSSLQDMFYFKTWLFQLHSLGDYDPKRLAVIFGALCERIESQGWRVSNHIGAASSKYRSELIVHDGTDQLYPANSNESLTHAAALAYVAALEAELPDCEECGGNGIDPMQQPDAHRCPSCQGIGKQKEAK